MSVILENGNSHGRVALPWRSMLLATVAIATYLVLGPSPETLIFDREGIVRGEWWRLVTAHWVHSDLAHAAWDITALVLLGAIFETRIRWQLPLILLFASAGVDVWLWWGASELEFYCGLSGVLNGLLAAGLVHLWRETRHPLTLLTAAGAVLKIAMEINTGQSLLVQTAWPSVPAAHAAGFLSGLVFMLVSIEKQRPEFCYP